MFYADLRKYEQIDTEATYSSGSEKSRVRGETLVFIFTASLPPGTTSTCSFLCFRTRQLDHRPQRTRKSLPPEPDLNRLSLCRKRPNSEALQIRLDSQRQVNSYALCKHFLHHLNLSPINTYARCRALNSHLSDKRRAKSSTSSLRSHYSWYAFRLHLVLVMSLTCASW